MDRRDFIKHSIITGLGLELGLSLYTKDDPVTEARETLLTYYKESSEEKKANMFAEEFLVLNDAIGFGSKKGNEYYSIVTGNNYNTNETSTILTRVIANDQQISEALDQLLEEEHYLDYKNEYHRFTNTGFLPALYKLKDVTRVSYFAIQDFPVGKAGLGTTYQKKAHKSDSDMVTYREMGAKLYVAENKPLAALQNKSKKYIDLGNSIANELTEVMKENS